MPFQSGIQERFVDGTRHWLPLVAWGAVVIVVIAGAVFVSNLISGWLGAKTSGEVVCIGIGVALVAAALLLVMSFLFIFKGVEANARTLNYMIVYCYAFTIYSLCISVVPFLVFSHVPSVVDLFESSPIGIVKGCSVTPDDAKDDYIPVELRCGKQTAQWVVNIGGVVMEPDEDDEAATGKIRGIQGGLIVPLYVIVLSLMGATVGMTRRVPEFQRRLSPGDPEYMTYGYAREAMVFLIMQVMSAPLIAMTIYYVVGPSARVSTIVVAFASGFSSETILLLIRALLEKIQPDETKVANRAHVRISPARLDFGNVLVGTSAKKTVALTNSTGLDLDVISMECTGEYSVAPGYPTHVKPGSSISVEVSFTPKSPGSKAGVLTVTDNAPGSPRAIDITGTAFENPPVQGDSAAAELA